MKKLILFSLILCGCFFLTGCKKTDEKDVLKQLKKNIEKSDGYNIKGELEIIDNEDSYIYDVEVAYKKGDNFKVALKNKVNNHEQIILRNSDGVYVITHQSTQL